jgi:hypothetical protein
MSLFVEWSYFLLMTSRCLGANKHQSYQELLGTIRDTLKSQRYSQIPQVRIHFVNRI